MALSIPMAWLRGRSVDGSNVFRVSNFHCFSLKVFSLFNRDRHGHDMP